MEEPSKWDIEQNEEKPKQLQLVTDNSTNDKSWMRGGLHSGIFVSILYIYQNNMSVITKYILDLKFVNLQISKTLSVTGKFHFTGK